MDHIEFFSKSAITLLVGARYPRGGQSVGTCFHGIGASALNECDLNLNHASMTPKISSSPLHSFHYLVSSSSLCIFSFFDLFHMASGSNMLVGSNRLVPGTS